MIKQKAAFLEWTSFHKGVAYPHHVNPKLFQELLLRAKLLENVTAWAATPSGTGNFKRMWWQKSVFEQSTLGFPSSNHMQIEEQTTAMGEYRSSPVFAAAAECCDQLGQFFVLLTF